MTLLVAGAVSVRSTIIGFCVRIPITKCVAVEEADPDLSRASKSK